MLSSSGAGCLHSIEHPIVCLPIHCDAVCDFLLEFLERPASPESFGAARMMA
jgi:hypothetical protein